MKRHNKHTLLPWHLGKPWVKPNGGHTIYGPTHDQYVADVYGGHHPDDVVNRVIGAANAAFIVLACNNHYALLQVAKCALADIEGLVEQDFAPLTEDDGKTPTPLGLTVLELQAAIALAKEDSHENG